MDPSGNLLPQASVSSRCHQWLFLVICSLIQVKAEVLQPTVEKTLVKDAVSKGAVCLDGSPAAYHYDKGFGDGVNNWVVFLEGGGWCGSVEDCRLRFGNFLGSSNHMNNTRVFSGLLDYNKTNNPDFYNWNRIMIKYCDGSSFTGDVESVDKATNQHYRGARIFQTIMEELLAKGMKNAKNAILSGNSAGGLAAMIHCDRFRSLLPSTPRVKCLSDGGIFYLTMMAREGKYWNQPLLQWLTYIIQQKCCLSCTSRKLDPTLCFFPQNLQQYIKTPLFIINSAYDSYQIQFTVIPSAQRADFKENCMPDFNNCSSDQQKMLRDFGAEFVSALPNSYSPSQRGMFVNSCFIHLQISYSTSWTSPLLMVNNKLQRHLVTGSLNEISAEIWSNYKICHKYVVHPLNRLKVNAKIPQNDSDQDTTA
ncbi:pectin acetylesterase 8-like [Lycium barbarum]|uniref:pectin acetylesterase 8-like n=1 Tax=Lycium barbarum TaxID=112863 RepID=UPI00293E4AD8|nr:pectin acetylesterase 8-like [Lycium barbarum]